MSAILSPCGTYRYRLERDVGMVGPVFAFFGVNPSTADATVNDATVRKWTGFVKRWGGRRFIVGNVFAYRATDVRELAKVSDPDGPENGKHLRQIIVDADVLVPCWGSRSKLPTNLRSSPDLLLSLLCGSGKTVECFGWTNEGDPKHPLMLGYDTTPICIAAGVRVPEKELGACSISRATIGDKTHDRRTEERDQRTGDEEPSSREAGRCDAIRASGAESGPRGSNAVQHEVTGEPGLNAPVTLGVAPAGYMARLTEAVSKAPRLPDPDLSQDPPVDGVQEVPRG